MTSPVARPAAGRRLRRVGVASLAAMALFGLSACGDADAGSKASDQTSSGAAASSSASDTSAKPSPGSEVSAADMADLFDAAFSKATSAHVTLTSQGGSFPLTAEGDASYDPVAISMTLDLASMGKAEVRLVDNTVYLKLAMLGDKYVKFDLDDPSNPLGSFAQQLDPAQLVKTLQGAITQATFVGTEDVDGEQLDHYTLQVDSQKMLASYGSAAPSTGASAAGLPATLTYDMWFDDQGLFRQMKFDLGSQGSFLGTFSNWGEKVDVTAPPASDVTDMPAFPTALPSS